MTDFTYLKERLDLLTEVEKDLGPGRRSGRWHAWRCPFHDGKRLDDFQVTMDNGRYFCFGCRRSGDVITWLHEYREMSWKEIEDLAGSDSIPLAKPRPEAKRQPEPSGPPSTAWQVRGLAFVADCESALWSTIGDQALDYLHARGLTDKTIRRYRLGYNLVDRRYLRASWSLPNDKPVWLPKGITIPWLVDGDLWGVNIRRFKDSPKYYKLPGSKSALLGAANLRGAEVVLLTEGEFDCMLADQELGDIAGVATLGSASKRLDLVTWGVYLLPVLAILVAYDRDQAGMSGQSALADRSARIHSVKIPVLKPGDKDLTDYWRAGGDLWEWFKYHLNRLGILLAMGIAENDKPSDLGAARADRSGTDSPG
jgi:DNA primase